MAQMAKTVLTEKPSSFKTTVHIFNGAIKVTPTGSTSLPSRRLQVLKEHKESRVNKASKGHKEYKGNLVLMERKATRVNPLPSFPRLKPRRVSLPPLAPFLPHHFNVTSRTTLTNGSSY